MHQQFSCPERVFVEDVALLVGIDVHTIDIDLVLVDPHEGFLDAAFSHTDGFDFRSKQLNAALKFLIDKIVMVSLLVVSYQFDCFFQNKTSCLFPG